MSRGMPSIITYPAIVGAVLRSYREKQDRSQASMAAAVGMSQANWSKIETGKSALTTSQLAKAAEVLEMLPGDVFSTVDQTVAAARKEGFTVIYEDDLRPKDVMKLLGAAAILGLIALVGSRKAVRR